MACAGSAGSPSVMEPVSGSWSVAMVRMRVDLPAPLGPSSPYMPLGMSRVMSRRARTPLGYVLETPRMARCIVGVEGRRARGERVASGGMSTRELTGPGGRRFHAVTCRLSSGVRATARTKTASILPSPSPPSASRSPSHVALLRQRIRPELEPDRLAGGPLPALHVEGGAGADGGPETAPLPAGLRVVDPAVQPLGVEPQRVGDAQDDPLSVLEDQEPLGLVPGVDRDVLAKAERVELVHPGVVAPLAAPRGGDVAELREGLGVEGPSLGT